MRYSEPATRRFPRILVAGLLVVVFALGYAVVAASSPTSAAPSAIGQADGVLSDETLSTYGSEAAAARWVATPTASAHVSGKAVDLSVEAARWLSAHGATYGLCRIYGNEPWHYELRPRAVAHGCPPTYADPTRDPRMRGAQ